MGRKMRVQQGLHPHAVELGHQEGNVIDAFTANGQGLGHGAPPLRHETLPQCSKPLKI